MLPLSSVGDVDASGINQSSVSGKESIDFIIDTCVYGNAISSATNTGSNVCGNMVSPDGIGRLWNFHCPATWNHVAFASGYPSENNGYTAVFLQFDVMNLAAVENFSSSA
jgi:hypothetical protein